MLPPCPGNSCSIFCLCEFDHSSYLISGMRQYLLKKNYLFLAVLGFHCCMWAFSSCSEWELLFVWLLIAVASLVADHRLQASRLQQLRLSGSRARTQQLWHTGLVAPWHVGSFRAQTCVPCINRWILIHCATRKEPIFVFMCVWLMHNVLKIHSCYSMCQNFLL